MENLLIFQVYIFPFFKFIFTLVDCQITNSIQLISLNRIKLGQFNHFSLLFPFSFIFIIISILLIFTIVDCTIFVFLLVSNFFLQFVSYQYQSLIY